MPPIFVTRGVRLMHHYPPQSLLPDGLEETRAMSPGGAETFFWCAQLTIATVERDRNHP